MPMPTWKTSLLPEMSREQFARWQHSSILQTGLAHDPASWSPGIWIAC